MKKDQVKILSLRLEKAGQIFVMQMNWKSKRF